MQVVEVAGELGLVLGPAGLEHADELLRAPVALVVLEPRLAERLELALEPAGDDVDGEAPAGDDVGGGGELGEHSGLPQPGVDGGDDLQFFGGEQQREAEAGGLVLVLGAVAGHVADLAERVLEATVLGEPRELAVVLDAPVGALLDLGDDKSAADVGHPVGELDGILACDGHLRTSLSHCFDCFYEDLECVVAARAIRRGKSQRMCSRTATLRRPAGRLGAAGRSRSRRE